MDWFDENAPKDESDWFAQNAPKPIEQQSPVFGEIVSRAGEAALDVGKGLVKSVFHVPTLSEVASIALGPVGVGMRGAYEQLKSIPETIHQVQQAETTPAYSKERFAAGANVASQLAMVALAEPAIRGFKAIQPSLAKVVEPLIGKAPEPTVPEPSPVVEQVATEAPPVPEAPVATTAPLSTETIQPEEVTNAVQEQSATGVLPRPQEAVGETGSLGERVGQGVQGEETPQTGVQQQAGQVEPVLGEQEAVVAPKAEGTGEVTPKTSTIRGQEISTGQDVRWMSGGTWDGKVQDIVKKSNGKHDVTVKATNGETFTLKNAEDYGINAGRSKFITDENKPSYEGWETDYPDLAPPVHETPVSTTASSIPKTEETAVTPETPIAEQPKTVPTPAETNAINGGEDPIGIAERYREEQQPGSVIPGIGRTADEARAWGHDFINKGGNPYDVVANKGPKRELWQDVGVVRAEYERLSNEKRAAESAWEANPDDPELKIQFEHADAAQRQWSKDAQPVLTRAGDALRAASRSYPREINSFSDFTDIVNDHFKGEVELTPEKRAELQKAVKAIKKGNIEATEARAQVTNEAVKKASGKVMSFDDLKSSLTEKMTKLLENCPT